MNEYSIESPPMKYTFVNANKAKEMYFKKRSVPPPFPRGNNLDLKISIPLQLYFSTLIKE
jgi:hypothetical protein